MPVRLRAIPFDGGGDVQTLQTVEAMRALARVQAADPTVRRAAIALAETVRERDAEAIISCIRAFLVRHIRFVDDPTSGELLQEPVYMLEEIANDGQVSADCEDVAMLGASLGESVGIPARFVMVAFGGQYEHVWAELWDGREWRELDTTRGIAGNDSPDISRQLTIDVDTGERMAQQLGGWGAAIQGGIALAQSLGGLLHGGRDPERIQATDVAYQEAIAGNAAALLFLKQRTGDYGVVDIPGIGLVGGWGSGTAKAYARQKYQQALGILAQQTPIGGDTAGVPNYAIMAVAAIGIYLLMSKRRRAA